MRNADTKEFLRLIGYDGAKNKKTAFQTRDEEKVASKQTAVLKAKVDSFKARGMG